jgi:hypothetical protein
MEQVRCANGTSSAEPSGTKETSTRVARAGQVRRSRGGQRDTLALLVGQGGQVL